MSRLLQHYDEFWREAYRLRSQKISDIAREIAATPKWRYLRRMRLSYEYSEAQLECQRWAEAADADTRDRLMLEQLERKT